jgi:hypothetical protein
LAGDRFPDLGSAPQAELKGTYLVGFMQEERFVGFWPGWTGTSFGQRFVEHTKAFLEGSYEIRDPQQLLAGKRVDLWPGGWYWNRTPWSRQWATLRVFCTRLDEFGPKLRQYLETLCILVAPIEEGRVAQRLEAALIETAIAGRMALSQIPRCVVNHACRKNRQSNYDGHLRCK